MICNKLRECVGAHFSGESALWDCPNGEGNCIQSFDKRNRITCGENGKRYTYVNTRGLDVLNYRMDGGVIKQDGTVPQGTVKCDHVIVVKDASPLAVFVELKGTDVSHALEQISETMKRESALVKSSARVYARIVMTGSVPKIQTTKAYKDLYQFILRMGGGNIKMRTFDFAELDTDLDKQ